MNRLVRLPGRGMAAAAIAGLLALATIAATPAAASAATVLKVRYPVNGSTFLKAANATVPLGPGALRSRVNLTTGGNLHVFNVSGCAGLINSGDATTFSGTYTVTPAQTITSP